MGSHAAVAAELLQNQALVETALRDYRSPDLPLRLRVLLTFVDKLNRAPAQVTATDVAVARHAGWSDGALYDAITVCALFNFYNRWVDGTGVGDLPAAAYEASGHRLATEGYAEGV